MDKWLLWHSSGVICVDWTNYGRRRKEGGPSSREFALWKYETKALAPGVIVVECSEHLPLEVISTDLCDHHWCSAIISPEDLGMPVMRRRRFSIGLHKHYLRWTDDADTSNMKDDILRLFGRTCCCGPDVFFVATESEMAGELIACAAAVQVSLTEEEAMVLVRGGRLEEGVHPFRDARGLHTLVRPGEMLRLVDYEEEHASMISSGSVTTTDTVIFDTSQSIERKRIGTKLLPTLTCSAHLYHTGRQRWLTAREELVAQGVRPSTSDQPFQNPWASIFEEREDPYATISRNDLRTLAGNTQHVAVALAVELYVLAHIEPKRF